MRDKTNFLFNFFSSQFIQRDTLKLTIRKSMLLMEMSMLVLLMDSGLKPVYAVLFSCKYSMICDNCSESRHF